MEKHRLNIFFVDFIYLFLDRGVGGERERERNINVWVPLARPLTADLACNPGLCPDQESNQRPFGSQARAQSTEPHRPGQAEHFKWSQAHSATRRQGKSSLEERPPNPVLQEFPQIHPQKRKLAITHTDTRTREAGGNKLP